MSKKHANREIWTQILKWHRTLQDDHLPGPTSDKRLSCDMLTQFFLNCKRSKTIQANIKLHYSTSKCMPFTLAGNLQHCAHHKVQYMEMEKPGESD